MLRKLLYSSALMLGAGTMLFAQSERAATAYPDHVTQSISNSNSFAQARKGSGANQVNALFDVQFNYNASAQRGSGGMAGVVWTGTEFWVSAWASDSMFTFDAAGNITSRFVVPGVGAAGSGVRALTWDGTNIYAGTNTTSIYEINPATKTLTATITAPEFVRGLAYDSTADGGLGGFWVSNYATDISLISRTGTLLNALPAATHGLTAMYGIAVDHYSTGGPYIWVFDQGSSPDQCDLRRIPIATGVPDVFMHNAMSDVGAAGTAGLAGGLCITWGLDTAGHRSIVGLLQGTPNDRLFAYELGDYTLPDVDAQAEALKFSPPYTFIPQFLVAPYFWDMDVVNFGANTLDTLSLILNVDSAGVNLFTDTSRMYNIASGQAITISTSNAYTPSNKGSYDVTGMVYTGVVQADSINGNDTIAYVMEVNDSTLGRDNNVVGGSLGIGGGQGGVLGQKFSISGASFASSVSFFCSAPTAGDSVKVELYTFTSSPGTIITSTPTYVFTLADQTNGVFLTLPFTTAPHSLAAGTYFVGVREYAENVSLGTTEFNFHPNTGFAQVPPSAAWTPVESASFFVTFILRLNTLDPLFVNVPHVYNQDVFTMYPNPAKHTLTVNTKGANSDAKLSLFDITGREVYNQTGVETSNTINLNKFSEGVYVVRMILDGNVYSEKVTITK